MPLLGHHPRDSIWPPLSFAIFSAFAIWVRPSPRYLDFGIAAFGYSWREMALSNFLLTVVGVGAVVLMLKGDVRKTYPVLRRNLRQVREWLEQEQGAASRSEHVKPKEVESGKPPEKPAPKTE
ncbi:unnamed protein product [Calypogeia fissa]